ncbi:MAG: flagellar assembly protein T N-terminal domain-containing protein [Synergistaceae bacterium]|nr:flagellar assembly protein T N-terminal domain-containing protein [Synergistaceae bacterium]
MKNIRKLTALLCVTVLLFCTIGTAESASRSKKSKKKAAPSTSVSVKTIEVEAEGSALIIDGRRNEAREEARRDLRRNAVDMAIGSFVESVTKIENYQVVRDKVFSQSKGMIRQMNIISEWVDDEDLLHLKASCLVSEVSLDTVLGPAVIDALGNPRIMIMLDDSVARSTVQKIFEAAGYMIINQSQAQILKDIDLEAARATGDYSKVRDAARNFRADVVITGSAGSSLSSKQKILGQTLYAVTSSVRLEAVLTDTAQTIASEEFSWRPGRAKDASLSFGEGAARGLSSCASRAAASIVNKIAYALTSGQAGGIPGRTVKVIITDIDYRSSRTLQDKLAEVEGVSGVYQRRYLNGNELEIDVVSDKSADELADILSDMGCNIMGVSGALVEGRK